MRFVFLSFLIFLSACTSTPVSETQEDVTLVLKPSSFAILSGWSEDRFEGISQAFERSCARIQKRDPKKLFGPDERWKKYGDWQVICKNFNALEKEPKNLKSFFEQNFIPHIASADNEQQGLFTGYYEASLRGSRTKKGQYQYPLRARPDDLVMVQLGEFRDDLKGRRIAGRVVNGCLRPYESHEDIVSGKLPDQHDKPLVWVDNLVDAFFVQIQGSGLVRLDDGSTMRIGYAGQNGHPYYAIGRELIKRGALTKENVSMQSIRDWLNKNPDQAQNVMIQNKSYVFFRELKKEGPVGGEGVALTAGRSLAIDHSIVPYGIPVWLEAEHPDNSQPDIKRLMIAQDTGGAIRGPVRGDFFWGYGADAEKNAGAMKSSGRYWFLIPR